MTSAGFISVLAGSILVAIAGGAIASPPTSQRSAAPTTAPTSNSQQRSAPSPAPMGQPARSGVAPDQSARPGVPPAPTGQPFNTGYGTAQTGQVARPSVPPMPTGRPSNTGSGPAQTGQVPHPSAQRGPTGQRPVIPSHGPTAEPRNPGQSVAGADRPGGPTFRRPPARVPSRDRVAARIDQCGAHCRAWGAFKDPVRRRQLVVSRLLVLNSGRPYQSILPGGGSLVITVTPIQPMRVVLLPVAYSNADLPQSAACSTANLPALMNNAAPGQLDACNFRAKTQSGFDPINPGLNGDQNAYYCVVTACLQEPTSTAIPDPPPADTPPPPPPPPPPPAPKPKPPAPKPTQDPPNQNQGGLTLANNDSPKTRKCRYVDTNVTGNGDKDEVKELYCRNDKGEWDPAQPAPAATADIKQNLDYRECAAERPFPATACATLDTFAQARQEQGITQPSTPSPLEVIRAVPSNPRSALS